MLMQQTLELLHSLRLTGMAEALEEQSATPDIATLDFEDPSLPMLSETPIYPEFSVRG